MRVFRPRKLAESRHSLGRAELRPVPQAGGCVAQLRLDLLDKSPRRLGIEEVDRFMAISKGAVAVVVGPSRDGIEDMRIQALNRRVPAKNARRGIADGIGNQLPDVVVVNHAAAPGDHRRPPRRESTADVVELVRALRGERVVPCIGAVGTSHC